MSKNYKLMAESLMPYEVVVEQLHDYRDADINEIAELLEVLFESKDTELKENILELSSRMENRIK